MVLIFFIQLHEISAPAPDPHDQVLMLFRVCLRIQQNIEDEGTTVSVGAHSYAATYLRYAAGTEDNDEIVEYYITEQNGTIFVVALGYFVGAEEGYGARLHAMLDTMTF